MPGNRPVIDLSQGATVLISKLEDALRVSVLVHVSTYHHANYAINQCGNILAFVQSTMFEGEQVNILPSNIVNTPQPITSALLCCLLFSRA